MPQSNPYLPEKKAKKNPYLRSDEAMEERRAETRRILEEVKNRDYGPVFAAMLGGQAAGLAGQLIKKPLMAAGGKLAATLEGAAAGGAGAGVETAAQGGSPGEVAGSAALGTVLGGGGGLAARQLGKTLNRPPKIEVEKPAPAPGSDEELVLKLTEGIKAAKPVRKEQAKLYSAERGKRIQEAMTAMESGGEQGFFNALNKLKGELPKVHFEGIRELFQPDQIDRLFNMAARAPIADWEKITAQRGLLKLLGIHGGTVPQKHELELLQEVYGPDLVRSAMQHRPMMSKVGSLIRQTIEIPRSLMTAPDVSAAGRQGIMMISRPEYWKSIVPMLKSFGSEKTYRAIFDDITSRENYQLMRQAGVALTDIGKPMTAREEHMMSDLAMRIPVIGKAVRASNRAHTAFLSKVRADVFDNVLMHSKSAGVDIDEHYIKSLGSMVNTLTGRGDLGALAPAANALNAALFSPRLMSARAQVFNPAFYINMHPEVRKVAIKSVLSTAAALSAVTGAAALSLGKRANVGLDPRSADFGKIKVGNTRVDLFGGHSQYVRLAHQLAFGENVSSTTGKVTKSNRLKVIGKFVENKAAPVASFIITMLRGKGRDFQPVSIPKEIMDRLQPMVLQDAKEAVKEWGPMGLSTVPLSTVGIGVQTYGGEQGARDSSNPYTQPDSTKR